ncbi:hypothetical protein RB195_003339 [Necator americanus]|uniref:Uncharacterized protein n=1 Tax=Necator americanus TaxID=51031 RepID=A0ABR1DN53_NECAM
MAASGDALILPREEASEALKIVLCCWWKCERSRSLRVPPMVLPINAEKYCEQLDRVAAKLRGIERNGSGSCKA